MNVIYPWRIRIAVIVLHVVGFAIFLPLGWFLGRSVGRSTLGLFLGLAISFPLIQIASWQLIKHILHSGPSEKQKAL